MLNDKNSPSVFQVEPISRGTFRDVIGGDGAIRAAQEHIRGELTAHNGNIRGQVHPQHTQHASWFVVMCASFSLSQKSVAVRHRGVEHDTQP